MRINVVAMASPFSTSVCINMSQQSAPQKRVFVISDGAAEGGEKGGGGREEFDSTTGKQLRAD